MGMGTFFEERDTMHNGEAFQNMLESLSDSYYVYECFGGDVGLKWSAFVIDINNEVLYTISHNRIERIEIKCDVCDFLNCNTKFNNSYVEGEITRGYSVTLTTLVNNSVISWVLAGGSISSKFNTDDAKKNDDLNLRRNLINVLKDMMP